jgi:hypothetical protein
MAMVLAAVGTAVTWVGTTAAAISASASFYLASVTGMSWVAAGTVVSAVSQLALSAATTALMTPSIGRGGSPIAFKADPSAPISGVMGRFGVGGRQLHANVWGKDNLFLSFAVALSLGPIQSVEGFTASGEAVTFPGAQGLAAATEPYINKMWQTYRLGLPTDAYLGPPTGLSDGTPTMSEWTSAHTLPGFAQTFWTMKNNSKREGYQSGVPAPLWTLLGMKVYDPRLDSTYPGGSGAQRRTDWTTWTYSANPYLHALAWVRGHHKLVAGGTIDLTKRLAGVGAPDAAIDFAAFVEGANVADANSWTISGEWTTADDKWQTLAAMLQAGGGVPISQGAQISCMVEAPRTSLMTVTGADIVGSVSLNVMASRRDRPNTVIPRVRLEAHKFEEVALGAVTSATYVTEDAEEKRVIETSYRFVGVAKQGAELAGYGLANTRETLKASIPCKPYLLGLRAGDAFTVTEPELGLSAQKFVVMRRSFDPSSSIVTLDVRSETDAKHAYALGQSADAPASPSLTAPDPVPTTPASGDWTIVARPVEASGVQQPGLIVTGPAVNENIGTVLVEYSTSGSGPWVQAYSGPPTIASVEINGLIGGTAYYVGITYWSVRGVPSAQLVKGPYTAPGMVSAASWTTTVTNRPTELTDGRITTALNGSGVLQTAIPSALADSSNILRRTSGGLYTGDLAATLGAAWGTNLTGRPTELTDGRIGTALNASGVLQTAIPSALADTSNILRRTGGGLFTGALAATDDSAVTALAGTLGPLATSALTEAKVQGRWFGQYAGDSAANTAGLQNGDSYVDTSVYPPVLKGKTGGTIYEISETGILLDTDTDVDLVGTGTTFTDVHSYTLPAAISTSSFFVIQLGLSIVSGTTVSGSGVTAPSGLWQIYEFDSASTDATKRLVHSGAWASQIVGAGPNAANLTDITVDGDNYSDISRQWKFKFGGGGILKLRMHQGGGPNLSNARSHIRVTIQRN